MSNKVVRAVSIIFLALVAVVAIIVLANFIRSVTGGTGIGTDLVGPTWQWTDYSDTASGETSIPDSSAYTISFNSDGTFNAKADCNNAGGVYTTDGSNIKINVQTSTRALCPPGSLSDQYLTYLGSARTYNTGVSSLRFDLATNGGAMFFGK